MASPKKNSVKSPTSKSKGPAKATTARGKASTKPSIAPKRNARPAKGVVAIAKDAMVEAVTTVLSGAVAGAAAAGTKLVEEKTGAVKRSVKSKSAVNKQSAAGKKRTAAAK